MKKRVLKKCLLLLLSLALSLSVLTACGYRGFKGEHIDLYTQAQHTLLFADGYSPGAEALFDPLVDVLETDTYGRRLYAYYEEGSGSLDILVSQSSDSEYVYYYPDICFINIGIDNEDDLYSDYLNMDKTVAAWAQSKIAEYGFTEAVEALKSENDWDAPKNDSKAEKALIKDKPDHEGEYELIEDECIELFLITAERCGYVIKEGATVDASDYTHHYAHSDRYGRELRTVVISIKTETPKVITTENVILAFILEPDGSYDKNSCAVILEDTTGYRDTINKLKTNNNWNKEN